MIKSPGGSLFPYYYKGGEIHCLKYGSKYKKYEELFELMRLEEEFIFKANKKLKIWIDLYETSTTEVVLQELVNNLNNLNGYVKKISFVGLSSISKWKLKRKIKNLKLEYPISYFSDPEGAKTWLISER
ncbi:MULTISPECIES: hypothetical protein [Paenibacillus]|uniref:SpoIIAA-like protein n=1 Tax=Paenibacillus pabuli TaxID=1472 RepID=A0A855Y432_9BACL|nr:MULTISPECIES: hypothetical protein [Paenibacillus]PWW45509.1 hypothetical protein DET56_101718 [Paenibacillus pabuli]PXW11846.1 hypothetical protein DEU73_101717 [Paenibacillus taichungensis]